MTIPWRTHAEREARQEQAGYLSGSHVGSSACFLFHPPTRVLGGIYSIGALDGFPGGDPGVLRTEMDLDGRVMMTLEGQVGAAP